MHLFLNSKFISLKLFIFTTTFLFFGYQGFAASPNIKDEVIASVEPATLMFPATSMPDRDWWQSLWPNPKEVVLSLGVKPGMSVVDLCCGYGYFTFPLAEIPTRVYGIELEEELLEEARKEAETRGIKNCHWIQGDAMNLLGLVPEPVDYVLLANTFHGIPEKEALTRSVAAILKPRGQFSIVNWHQKPREETTVLGQPRGPKTEMRMSPEQVVEILLPLGFELKEIVELPPYHYGAVFTKL
jgi:Methylase involved in ubiquinone/menaquinone biosynthesis